MPKIYLINLPAVCAEGLTHILQRGEMQASVCVADSIDDIPASDTDAYYITTLSAYADNTDFFLSRRRRMMIWDTGRHEAGIGGMHVISLAHTADEILAGIASVMNSADDAADDAPLTSREIEIIRLLARGHSTRSIAETLFISANTVATHRKNISRKLGIRTASGISTYALMHGLI